jgi:sugar phosphate permease
MGNKLSFEQYKVGAASFFSLFSLVGFMFYGLPFFYDFWVKDFGWSHATVTSGNAVGKIVMGLFAFAAGWIIDRFGPRRVMLVGILIGGGAVIGLSMITSIWQFYFFYILTALAYMTAGPLPNQVLISRWFDKSRGKAMGVAYLGIGIGGMIVPQVNKFLIDHLGWHNAMMMLGVLMILIAFPMVWFVKDNNENKPEEIRTREPKVPLKTIFKNRNIYLLIIGSMCSIGAVSGTSQNLKLFLSLDLNYSQQLAANLISIVLASSLVGRLFMGWLADRWPKKYVMILIYIIVAGSLPLLYFASTPGIIYVFAFFFGVGLGGDYMIIPLMAAELFGVRVLGRIMGIILTADGFGEALSPLLVGWLRDRGGSYTNGFTALIILAIIGAIAISLLPKKPDYS